MNTDELNGKGRSVTTIGPSEVTPEWLQVRGVIPEWLRIPDAIKISSIKKTSLYGLIKEGRVVSKLLKTHRYAKRGIRLVHRQSLLDCISAEGNT